MTPLRQRRMDDMQLRNLAPATQRNYIHHVARFASYYGLSPEEPDLEDIRQFQLYLLHDRQYSPEAVRHLLIIWLLQHTPIGSVERNAPTAVPQDAPPVSIRVCHRRGLPAVLGSLSVAEWVHLPSMRARASL